MKSSDPGRYKAIKKIEEKILAGEDVDRKTGRAFKLKEEDELVELEPEDHLWLFLAGKLSPAIPPDGSLPLPSEAREVFEHGLGRARIMHPENQAFALEHLEHYFAGRAEGLAVRFEKPKGKGKGDRSRRLGSRRRPPRRPTRMRRK